MDRCRIEHLCQDLFKADICFPTSEEPTEREIAEVIHVASAILPPQASTLLSITPCTCNKAKAMLQSVTLGAHPDE